MKQKLGMNKSSTGSPLTFESQPGPDLSNSPLSHITFWSEDLLWKQLYYFTLEISVAWNTAFNPLFSSTSSQLSCFLPFFVPVSPSFLEMKRKRLDWKHELFTLYTLVEGTRKKSPVPIDGISFGQLIGAPIHMQGKHMRWLYIIRSMLIRNVCVKVTTAFPFWSDVEDNHWFSRIQIIIV